MNDPLASPAVVSRRDPILPFALGILLGAGICAGIVIPMTWSALKRRDQHIQDLDDRVSSQAAVINGLAAQPLPPPPSVKPIPNGPVAVLAADTAALNSAELQAREAAGALSRGLAAERERQADSARTLGAYLDELEKRIDAGAGTPESRAEARQKISELRAQLQRQATP